MGRLRVNSFAVSLDGYGAGPGQGLDNPLGRGGEELHRWFFPTRTFQRLYGKGEGTTGVDEDFAARGMAGLGAWILGRNMFGPVRGPWPGRKLARLVGRGAALSCAGVRAHPSRKAAAGNGGRHDLPLRHRRASRKRSIAPAGGRRTRHPRRRRRRDDPAISRSRADRRDAPRHRARSAGRRRGRCSPGSTCRRSAMRSPSICPARRRPMSCWRSGPESRGADAPLEAPAPPSIRDARDLVMRGSRGATSAVRAWAR